MIIGTASEWMLLVARTKLKIALSTSYWSSHPRETAQITSDVHVLEDRIAEEKISGWWPGGPE